MNIKSSWFPKLFYILHQHPIPKLILEQVSFFFLKVVEVECFHGDQRFTSFDASIVRLSNGCIHELQ